MRLRRGCIHHARSRSSTMCAMREQNSVGYCSDAFCSCLLPVTHSLRQPFDLGRVDRRVSTFGLGQLGGRR
eukprot:6307953-Pyramimonas_sp.AAC.1